MDKKKTVHDKKDEKTKMVVVKTNVKKTVQDKKDEKTPSVKEQDLNEKKYKWDANLSHIHVVNKETKAEGTYEYHKLENGMYYFTNKNVKVYFKDLKSPEEDKKQMMDAKTMILNHGNELDLSEWNFTLDLTHIHLVHKTYNKKTNTGIKESFVYFVVGNEQIFFEWFM